MYLVGRQERIWKHACYQLQRLVSTNYLIVLCDYSPKPFVNLCLIWLEWNAFSIHADIPRFLIFGSPPVCGNFVVPDNRHLEKLIVFQRTKSF